MKLKLFAAVIAIVIIAVGFSSMPMNNALASNYMANANAKTIYSYLKNDMNLNDAACAAVLANMYAESGFNPLRKYDEGGYYSYGICQWNQSRYSALVSYCTANGYDWQSLNGQLHYFEKEIKQSYSSVYSRLINADNSEQGAHDAAYYFCVAFEIPANKETVGNDRGNSARQIYYELDPQPETTNYDGLQFINVSRPTTWVMKSAGWSLTSGALVSDSTLTECTSEIIRASDNTVVSSATRNCSGNRFSLMTLDDYSGTDNGVRFSFIYTKGYGAGTYIWRLTGKDSSGRVIVLSMPFEAVTSGSDVNGSAEFIGPRKPSLSYTVTDDLHETRLTWATTADTTRYDIRITDDKGNTNLADGVSMLMLGADATAYSALLPAGNYTASIASVYTDGGSGTWIFGDKVKFTVAAASTPSAGTIAKEVEGNHQLYKVYSKECTWLEAEAIAKASAGSFVTIESAEEQSIISTMMKNAGIDAWIGAERYRTGKWQWVNGNSMNYTAWNQGEPNNADGIENTAGIYATNGLWNDFNSSSRTCNGYILEYMPTAVTVEQKPSSTTAFADLSKSDLTVMVTFEDGATRETSDYELSLQNAADGMPTIKVTYGALTALAVYRAQAMGEPDFTLPANLKTIEAYAFQGLKMTVVKCPDGLETIGSFAFANCASLKQIYIPKSVTSIAGNAFNGITGLTIYGAEDSVAQLFAENRGFKFVTMK